MNRIYMSFALFFIAAAAAISTASAQGTSPKPTPTPNPFTYSGYFRLYDFTRQNASGFPNTFKAVNQQSITGAISLHGEYKFIGTPISIGGTYLFASPFNGCTTPVSHLTPPCGKQTFSASNPNPINPDDTLPGFNLSTLYEAYVLYKDPALSVKLGNQVINTPWANPSDSRLKPVAFQGGDLTYKFSKMFSGEAGFMDRFESRASSAFDNSTMLTSHPVDGPGAAGNIFTPGGGPIGTSGFGYGKLAYANGPATANAYYYGFLDIAAAYWLDSRYNFPNKTTKPFVAIQAGYETNNGDSVIGKIQSTVLGIQAGITPLKGLDVTLGYDNIPMLTDRLVLPAGVSCGTNFAIKTNAGVTFPYFLPSGGTTNCMNNSDGTTSIFYGGWASPYTDSYATDQLFTTSISQGMIDRRSPGNAWKIAGTWQTPDKRFRFIGSQAWYTYNTPAGSSPTQELDLDGTYFFQRFPKSGPYHGFSLRHRYAERNQQNTALFGGTPLFKYNRTQLQFDF